MNFLAITLTDTTDKPDSEKFLQGQLTINTQKLTATPKACAICDLKGRVAFGLWVSRQDQNFTLITHADCMDALVAHIKKFGAFSKFAIASPTPIYPCVAAGLPTFCQKVPTSEQLHDWQKKSLEMGNYWISAQSQHLFQPQELRLHQRGGVDYDKGCYLGQEIVARLYFKAAPKAYLHRVLLNDEMTDINTAIGQKIGQGTIVNAIDNNGKTEALVVIKPDVVSSIGDELPIFGLVGQVARER